VIPEPLRVTLAAAKALERMGVPYFVGGSLASSVHGVARATLDADIIAKLEPEHAGRFAKELGPEFYADVDAITDVEMKRRQSHVIDESTGERMTFATAEDTLLAKLLWYRQGNEVSDRQWRDALGILRVAGQGLDGSYLSLWAGELNVADLLDRAFREVGRG
jgi:hypothetical protein